MPKTQLGGNRLGAGPGMMVDIPHVEGSNHDLSTHIDTTLSVGPVDPIAVFRMLPGYDWKIHMDFMLRSNPVMGALDSVYKLQVDVFSAEDRLYHRIMHNYVVDLGYNLKTILHPLMTLKGVNPGKVAGLAAFPEEEFDLDNIIPMHTHASSLLRKLGITAFGCNSDPTAAAVTWRTNAIPLLMYWEIMRNYYCNKQEKNAYVIGADISVTTTDPVAAQAWWMNEKNNGGYEYIPLDADELNLLNTVSANNGPQIPANIEGLLVTGPNLFADTVAYNLVSGGVPAEITDKVYQGPASGGGTYCSVRIMFSKNVAGKIVSQTVLGQIGAYGGAKIVPFPLSNISDMRETILGTSVSTPLILDQTKLPYKYAFADATAETVAIRPYSAFPLAGLGLRTYLNDRFNSWLRQDAIVGANGITAMYNVTVANGKLDLNDLNLGISMYNLLNRLAAAGGDLSDYQFAVYGEELRGNAERPVYHGGCSTSIGFNEVVSTAAAGDQPLGYIGGRGAAQAKASHIRVKANSWQWLMICASIVPKSLIYSQTNMWWTEALNMDYYHKPPLDGIGFQDLLAHEMHGMMVTRPNADVAQYIGVGKQPAWSEYGTNVNRAYGDFADKNRLMFMILDRRYKATMTKGLTPTRLNIDSTTYIDPAKFNHNFADTRISAQNFWLMGDIIVKAYNKGSANEIPSL